MKYISVIAIKHGNQYISSVCYSNDPDKAFTALAESFNVPNSALYIVSQGDSSLTESGELLTFYQDLQYTWAQCCPVLQISNEGLVDHAKSIGASALFLYEDGEWGERWRYTLEEARSIA